MFGAPQPTPLQQTPSSKFQVGMVDPYLNEVVTHVAELDEGAIRRQSRIAILPFLIFTLVIPCFWVMACIVWCMTERQSTAAIRVTQVYLTEHTLVYVEAGQAPIEFRRVTMPLSNIASVMVQPGVMTVIIKPTASEVMLTVQHAIGGPRVSTTTAFPTRSVPINHVYNAEEFAKIIQGNLP